jgi:hypothetical protein
MLRRVDEPQREQHDEDDDQPEDDLAHSQRTAPCTDSGRASRAPERRLDDRLIRPFPG